jgi:polyhydroxybutyrate depolymerase
MSRAKKIALWVVGIVIGIPVLLVLVGWTVTAAMDRTNGTIVSSGLTRRYLLYFPKSYDRTKAAPLVISLHPAATWPAVEQSLSGWNAVAHEHRFIVLYPAGTGAFFGGLGPGAEVFPMGPQSLPRDARFISDLIDKIAGEYKIDADRIYVDGMSNGGGMAFMLGCRLADRIAAVGVVAGAQDADWEEDCGELKGRPVPLVAFHGTADKLAPYLGGSSPIAPRAFVNIPEWAAKVARRNQCGAQAKEERVSASVRQLAYGGCPQNAEVVLYTIDGGGHTRPGGKPLAEWWAGKTTGDQRDSHRVEVFWPAPASELAVRPEVRCFSTRD